MPKMTTATSGSNGTAAVRGVSCASDSAASASTVWAAFDHDVAGRQRARDGRDGGRAAVCARSVAAGSSAIVTRR